MRRKALRSFIALFMMICVTLSFSQTIFAAPAPRLNLKKLDLTKGTTFTLRVYNLDEDETAAFKSTNTDVVAIDSVGEDKKSAVIFGKTVGSATIKVTIKKAGGTNTTTLKCKIKVAPIPVSIKFSEGSITLLEGKQAWLDAIIKPYSATETPVFESSDENVCVVNVRGLVTAISPGKATVTATLLSTGKTAKCVVIVKEDTSEN
ncbi:MAG: Ig-like domain-containing protein [Eubacterium sp.]|nr:Ig-like domain-containing protein [Eubacterium sp.]